MAKNHMHAKRATGAISAQPRLHQRAGEIQAYGTVSHLPPLELEEPVRLEVTAQLNQLLADTMTLLDLYKKSHWQVAGPTFYQLHLLFDKHYDEQVELVDSIAERIQLLGGVSIAMAADVAEITQIERPPRSREAVVVQLNSLRRKRKNTRIAALGTAPGFHCCSFNISLGHSTIGTLRLRTHWQRGERSSCSKAREWDVRAVRFRKP